MMSGCAPRARAIALAAVYARSTASPFGARIVSSERLDHSWLLTIRTRGGLRDGAFSRMTKLSSRGLPGRWKWSPTRCVLAPWRRARRTRALRGDGGKAGVSKWLAKPSRQRGVGKRCAAATGGSEPDATLQRERRPVLSLRDAPRR